MITFSPYSQVPISVRLVQGVVLTLSRPVPIFVIFKDNLNDMFCKEEILGMVYLVQVHHQNLLCTVVRKWTTCRGRCEVAWWWCCFSLIAHWGVTVWRYQKWLFLCRESVYLSIYVSSLEEYIGLNSTEIAQQWLLDCRIRKTVPLPYSILSYCHIDKNLRLSLGLNIVDLITRWCSELKQS